MITATPHIGIATQQLPDINTVNFADPFAVEAYVNLMVEAANQLGADDPGVRPSAEWLQVRVAAREVVSRLDSQWSDMKPGCKIMFETAYDLAHRFAFMQPADSALLDRHVFEALDSRLRGDSTVDEYTLFRAIDSRVRRREKAFLGKAAAWRGRQLEKWVRQTVDSRSDYATANRISILLRSDLTAYLPVADRETFRRSLIREARFIISHPSEDLPTRLSFQRLTPWL